MSGPTDLQPTYDAFGNPIDISVGYARGDILKSSSDEVRRLQHCRRIASQRVASRGLDSIGIFTGNNRLLSLEPLDEELFFDEWIGTFLIEDAFRTAALHHLGARTDDQVFLFNRTSAGIICAISALCQSMPVLSIVPRKGRSHVSVQRGCINAGVQRLEVSFDQDWKTLLLELSVKLVIITGVTSKLEFLKDHEINEVCASARAAGAIILLDDAYGARMRPAIYGGASSLDLDVDLAITNCDKACLHGPRAGLLGGRPHLVDKLSTLALEWGAEGRAPLRVAVLRALQGYSHQALVAQVQQGKTLTAEMQKRFDPELVVPTPLGPMFPEESLLAHLNRRNSTSGKSSIVPCEATAALGALLLRDHGILTINTHGQPGASVSLRLKPTTEALTNVGGVHAVADALESAIRQISEHLHQKHFLSQLIMGN